ncbi:hypothetical protein Sjap_013993 [Stephania japonica]|uniref:ARM repeat superfamily protein n=1 Tax=Stephania japonica TaxID=461633 RepID=A0AAP0P1U6_9MAGN
MIACANSFSYKACHLIGFIKEGDRKNSKMEDTRLELLKLSEPIRESLLKSNHNPPEGTNVSVKSMFESLLPDRVSEKAIRVEIRDFCLLCAALASAEEAKESALLSWVPRELRTLAVTTFKEVSRVFVSKFSEVELGPRVGEFGLDFDLLSDEGKLVVELMPEVLPLLRGNIKESSIDAGDDGDEISDALARTPVACAIVAAHQFRWFVTQVQCPNLGKLCSLVIPCGLVALDHWSPAVKEQGMISFIHLTKNVKAAELGFYEDVILDTCCQNIASDDELWDHVVEMSVLLLTLIQRKNPRSPWFEKIMNEMLGHLERQPRNKGRYTAWLELIDPVFECMGLVLLAHFRRIFPLLLHWVHSDDDKIVLLVLEKIHIIIKLTWIRKSPYVGRLIDELIVTYKEASLRRQREDIRNEVLQILLLLQKCKGLQFEAAWNKHKDDPNLTALAPAFCTESTAVV